MLFEFYATLNNRSKNIAAFAALYTYSRTTVLSRPFLKKSVTVAKASLDIAICCNVVVEKGSFWAMLLFSHSQPPAPTAVFLVLKWPRKPVRAC